MLALCVWICVAALAQQHACTRAQGVPAAVFEALEAAAKLRREHNLELPARVERDQLRDYALLPQRAHLLRLTSRMSAFANGLLGPTLSSSVSHGYVLVSCSRSKIAAESAYATDALPCQGRT